MRSRFSCVVQSALHRRAYSSCRKVRHQIYHRCTFASWFRILDDRTLLKFSRDRDRSDLKHEVRSLNLIRERDRADLRHDVRSFDFIRYCDRADLRHEVRSLDRIRDRDRADVRHEARSFDLIRGRDRDRDRAEVRSINFIRDRDRADLRHEVRSINLIRDRDRANEQDADGSDDDDNDGGDDGERLTHEVQRLGRDAGHVQQADDGEERVKDEEDAAGSGSRAEERGVDGGRGDDAARDAQADYGDVAEEPRPLAEVARQLAKNDYQ